jgi:SAM-dependent methyltransferase
MLPGVTPYLLRHVDEALAFGNIQPGEKVLDIGCGMGRHSFVLAERGILVEGLELSPFHLERMREFDNGRYNIPAHCSDIVDHPEELDGRFDALIGFFVLHHILDLEGAFDAMARLLRPGGRMVFVEPNPLNPLYYLQILCTPGMAWRAERGILNMRPAKLFAAMAKAGLTEPAVRRFGFFPPFLTNTNWGARAESILERPPLWRGLLPFQLLRCTKGVPK